MCEKNYKELGAHYHSHTKTKRSYEIGHIWNKGLTKQSDARIQKSAKTFSENLKSGKTKCSFKGKKHKKETIEKLRLLGGYRKGSGRGISGKFKGYYCDSSWELAYVIYCLENNIALKRNTEFFEYTYEDKKHKYLPDFKIGDDYIEIKGYMTSIDVEKIKQFPKNKILKVLGKLELKEVFEYVIKKYGKNYVELYEKKPM